MLELGVDEITLVIQPSKSASHFPVDWTWEQIAQSLMYIFCEKAEFEKIFGEKRSEVRIPQGYQIACTFGLHDFYMALAYHPYHRNMGIVVKFSAQAFAYYCEHSGLNVYQFLQKVQDHTYTIRLSRIDMTADYIDEGIDVTEINNTLVKGTVAVFREYSNTKTNKTEYRKCFLERQARMKESEVETIYLGSIYSAMRLRIYDKKAEQIQRMGSNYQKAYNCTDWVRFEVCFRQEYAHKLTEELLKVQSDTELANLIAVSIAQKYRFIAIDKGVLAGFTEYTKLLIDCITNNNFSLKTSVARNFELTKNIAYIFHGSGVLNTLYKIQTIWGRQALEELFEYIRDNVDEHIPNNDCRSWLNKNAADYKKNFPDFSAYMRENVVPFL